MLNIYSFLVCWLSMQLFSILNDQAWNIRISLNATIYETHFDNVDIDPDPIILFSFFIKGPEISWEEKK